MYSLFFLIISPLYSNDAVERIFSQVKLIKLDIKNSMTIGEFIPYQIWIEKRRNFVT